MLSSLWLQHTKEENFRLLHVQITPTTSVLEKNCNSRGAALSVLRTIWNAVGLFYSEFATEMKIKYALVLAFLSLLVNKVYGNC